MTEIYIVYLYNDYRKDVDIQHLCAFDSKEKAVNFAKQYTSDEKRSFDNYVSIKGQEYDAELYSFDPDQEHELSDEEVKLRTKRYIQMQQDLKIKRGMWYIRIAVDKVILKL